jgi:hypothetical protein
MYKAILFAADGDWVTDYAETETVAEVEERLADQGSRWYFYPFHAVIRDHGPLTTSRQRIVADLTPFGDMEGRTIRTFARMIAETPEEELDAIIT